MKKLTTLLAIFAIAGLGLTSCDQSGTDEIVYPSLKSNPRRAYRRHLLRPFRRNVRPDLLAERGDRKLHLRLDHHQHPRPGPRHHKRQELRMDREADRSGGSRGNARKQDNAFGYGKGFQRRNQSQRSTRPPRTTPLPRNRGRRTSQPQQPSPSSVWADRQPRATSPNSD